MKRVALAVVAAILTFLPAESVAGTGSPDQLLMSKLHWRSIGPFIGGRVVAVAGVATNPDLFYMGGVEGGIWRSTNYGQSWENITDGKIPLTAYSIGAIAVAPSNPNVIYFGTGESDIRGDWASGIGIFKSTDAGKTWRYSGLKETHETSSLIVDPHNPNVVYVTSMGHVFKPNPQRGVYKSVDSGKSWKKILFVNDETGANDIVMDPRNPNVLYASMWQAQRTPWGLTSGGPGSGLYKSTDGGARWTKISANPGFARGLLGKIGVAVARTNPRIVYAIVQAKEGGVFRSDDAGATWKRVNGEWKLRQRAFYYMAIYVSPTKASTVYAPEVDGVFKSTDSGKTWKPFMAQGGDHHIIWVNPLHPNVMLEGDDGGATVSVDGGKTWSTEDNQPTGQFYHVVLDNRFPYHVYGAQQDEGSFEGPSASHEGLTPAQWHTASIGESTFIAVDPRDPNVTYGSGYFSSLADLNVVTGDQKNVSPWPFYPDGDSAAQMKYRFGWTHPILFSPANPDELFEAAQVVFESDDFGHTWRVISPDLTRNDKATEGPSGGPIDLDQAGTEIFPDINTLAVSPLDGNVMWAGSQDGLVHLTTDGGKHWTLVTPPQLPQWAEISTIEASHADAETAYLSATRYMWDDFHPYVYKTTDYGAHWTTLTNGLPDDQYVFVVREDPRDPRLLFAGTRSTVYVSLDGGDAWQPLTLDLPGVQVRDIAIDAPQGQVVVATHGRSFWILDNLALLEQLANNPNRDFAQPLLFAPEKAWLTHAYGGGNSDAGENPPYGATVFFNVPDNYDGKTPVTLSFLDANGNVVRSFTLHLRNEREKRSARATKVTKSALPFYELEDLPQAQVNRYDLDRLTAIDPGMNSFQWDMRYAPAREIDGDRLIFTDDYSEVANGPTILPGTYTVVLDYGGTRLRKSFDVALDPRLHPQPGALQARLALMMQIRDTLERLDTIVNRALAARSHLPPAKQADVDSVIARTVQLDVHSSEADLLVRMYLRAHLGFLLGELDLAYQAPTPAEEATFLQLRDEANAAVSQLNRDLR